LAALGPGDGNDVLAAREHPGERKLGRRRLLLARELLDALHQLEVAVEVLSLEAGAVPAPVVCGNVLGLAELAGEEAAAERAVRHEADPELADRGQDLLLDVPRPARILGLQRGDGVDLVRAPAGLRRGRGWPLQRAPRCGRGRTCPQCPGSRSPARSRGGWSRSTPGHRGRSRTRSSPCSRGPSRRPPAGPVSGVPSVTSRCSRYDTNG